MMHCEYITSDPAFPLAVAMGGSNSRRFVFLYNWTPDLHFERVSYDEASEDDMILVRPRRTRLAVTAPVRDQLNLGASPVHALLSAYERVTGFASPSRLFVYHNMRRRAEERDDDGVKLVDAIASLLWYGTCAEERWPYAPARFDETPTEACYAEATRSPPVRAYSVEAHQLRALLSRGYPVLAGMQIYASYEEAEGGDLPVPASNDVIIGGHAVLIVGYDDDRARYTFQNSRGTEWGDAGYGTLPYIVAHDPSKVSSLWTIKLDRDPLPEVWSVDASDSISSSAMEGEIGTHDDGFDDGTGSGGDSREAAETVPIGHLGRVREDAVLEHHAQPLEAPVAHPSLPGGQPDVDRGERL